MKVAVIGNGNVGMATFRELQDLPEISEIVLVGRNEDKLKAEIKDYEDAYALRTRPCPFMSCGGYDRTKDADIIIYTAGAAQKPGQTRLELVEQNVKITQEIFEEINKYNRDSIVICISNPVDILTLAIQKTTGRPREKVIGTGTFLDSARCIKAVSALTDISPHSIQMYVIGEHGDSSVTALSSLRISGMDLNEFISSEIGDSIKVNADTLASVVRKTAGKLINAKGYTAYGVAAAAAHIVSAIIHDSRKIIPVSVILEGEYGVNGIAISVPCLIGKYGMEKIFNLKLTDEEYSGFIRSSEILKKTAESVNLI